MKYIQLLILNTAFLFIAACSKPATEPVTIAINPWPGYEFLFLAEQKKFFQQVGANIKLIQLASLADAQRAYISGRVDGLASTLIEAVQAEALGGKPIKISLIADYSNGGDVIIANSSIENMQALKGKTVGCEVSSLGIFILQRALEKAGLSLNDVKVVNTEQMLGKQALANQDIDAFVTYPPVSVDIQKLSGFHTIFSSAEIPFEIIDAISIAADQIEKNPKLVPQLHQAWQMALDFSQSNPQEAYQIMSEREGISVVDFKDALKNLVLIDQPKQKKLFAKPDKIQKIAKTVCETLVKAQSLSTDCSELSDIVHRGEI